MRPRGEGKACFQPLGVAITPDTRLAVFAADQGLDLWLSDLGPTLTRIT